MATASKNTNQNPSETTDIDIPSTANGNCNCADRAAIDQRKLRHLEFMPNGSISASGYFDGLNITQARQSLQNLQAEFKRVTTKEKMDSGRGNIELDETNSGGKCGESEPLGSDTLNECGNGSVPGNIQEDAMLDADESPIILHSREEKQYEDLHIYWSKRNWGTKFELYHQYDGSGKLTLQWWNRLLNWIWKTLSEDHMTHLQQFLFRLRTSATSLPSLSHKKTTGVARSPLQQALIHDYHKVLRAGNTEDLVRVRQRFHLTSLARSHSAYVQEYRTKGMSTQTARQHINQFLLDMFTKDLNTPISQQTVRNHMKEARHWQEVLDSKQMQRYSQGLLLLLPVKEFSDLALKTCDSAWLFLFENLANISPRTVQLAEALQPIAENFQSRGVGNVNCPLLSYELRSATDLHTLSRHEFNLCLNPNLGLDIPDALRTITAHGRTENPHKIASLVKQDWERKNRRDALAFKMKADSLRRSSQRDIQRLERQAQKRLSKSVEVIEASRETRISENDSDSESSSSRVIEVQDKSMDDVCFPPLRLQDKIVM